ncbi:metallophosphoesterase family protein [Alteribacillus sp. YIM 98480]|uniref:metallophosphoesterase family protein n=1 Tax=Alteribacillus sp. YIM 98480 TaxID=2606599 RepID=UPI00131D22C6|nr:metallophosphoesterase family protein [Alteribacillus sp. YIM 98480]
MREIFISDIHGQFKAFTSLLSQLNYNPRKDQLYLLGDYIDRGPQSNQLIRYLLQLQQIAGEHVVFLKGNHERMMLDAFENADDSDVSLWIQNGGRETLKSYAGNRLLKDSFDEIHKWITNEFAEHYHFIKNLENYRETKEHILVHAGINPSLDNWKETPEEELLWIRSPFLENTVSTTKKVIFGHTPTMTLQEDAGVWFQPDKIGIDGGAGFNKQLNALIYHNGEYHVESVIIET